jgi:hypothetical protein
MKRYLILGAAAVAFAIPAGALADTVPTAQGLAVNACKTQQLQLGVATFKATYGGAANAFGKCVSKTTRADNANLTNAAAACKAEQATSDADFQAAHDGKTFAAFYGVNGSTKGKGADSNAYGKCVSAKAKAATTAETQATIAAAKACKAQRTASASTFASTYGAKANAFGVCVSRTAKS